MYCFWDASFLKPSNLSKACHKLGVSQLRIPLLIGIFKIKYYQRQPLTWDQCYWSYFEWRPNDNEEIHFIFVILHGTVELLGQVLPKEHNVRFHDSQQLLGGTAGTAGHHLHTTALLLLCRAGLRNTPSSCLTGTHSARQGQLSELFPHFLVLWRYRQLHFLLLPAATAQGNKATAGMEREKPGRSVPKAKVQRLCSTPTEHSSHLIGMDFS